MAGAWRRPQGLTRPHIAAGELPSVVRRAKVSRVDRSGAALHLAGALGLPSERPVSLDVAEALPALVMAVTPAAFFGITIASVDRALLDLTHLLPPRMMVGGRGDGNRLRLLWSADLWMKLR
jgi:hypothetical protein